jgi:hypothetical protein
MKLPDFPNTTDHNCRRSSAPTFEYNCLAWSVHRQDVWMWPDEREQFAWPIGMVRGDTLANLRSFFERIGFSVCFSEHLEPGFEKIAIYGQNDIPEHVARQLPNGTWTSKLSGGIDVEHDTLNVLEHGKYGVVRTIMQKGGRGPWQLPPLHPGPARLITPSGMPLVP